MISMNDLKRISAKEDIPQATIEKDYVITVALNEIAKTKLAENLVFKGGTAIKKIYFEKARFSEDLDFTVVNKTPKKEIISMLSNTFAEKEVQGVHFEEIIQESTSEGLKASLKFNFLLSHPQRIRFDFSFRENLFLMPKSLNIIESYGLNTIEIHVMDLQEIFAEKMHALGSRSASRDLYDIWFLFENNVHLDKWLVEKKFAYYNEKLNTSQIIENIKNLQQAWGSDLTRLIKKIKSHKEISRIVEAKINTIF